MRENTVVRKIKRICTCSKGGSHIWTVVIMLSVVIIFAGVLEVAQIISLASGVRKDTQLVIDSFVTKTGQQIFSSISNGDDYVDDLDEAAFYQLFESELGLEDSGGLYYHSPSGVDVFIISDLDVDFAVADSVKLKMSYTLQIPVRAFNKNVTDIEIPMTLRADYYLK